MEIPTHRPLDNGSAFSSPPHLAGNPLLAVQMSRLLPEVALYAPLRFAVYLDEADQTFVAYDNFALVICYHLLESVKFPIKT